MNVSLGAEERALQHRKCARTSTLMEISYEYGVVGLRTDTLTDR